MGDETDKMILFSGLKFLFCFFPAFLAVYYITPKNYRNLTLLSGSLIFYLIAEPKFTALLILMVFLNYGIGKRICCSAQNHSKKRLWLIAGLLLNIGLLSCFKIRAFGSPDKWIPLGLSFYLFKMLSFLADLYSGKLSVLPGFGDAAVYFTMFPQIISGPIMRYQEGNIPAKSQTYSLEKLEAGMQSFILGLALKILLADRLAILWKDIHTIGYESISTPLAWLGAGAYSMELYFDFWGYSLMSSGICLMLGFPFIQNFRHPYASRSLREFWRRWHITLGAFFRDYVYIPLGGSHKSSKSTLRNLLLVWLLTGFWHGEGPHYILWGLSIFCFLSLEKLVFKDWLEKHSFLSRCYVLFVISVTWIIFAVPDFGELCTYLGRLFPFTGSVGISVNSRDIVKYLRLYWYYLVPGILLCIPSVSGFYEKHRKHPAAILFTVIIFWLSVYCIIRMGSNPFTYLKF